MRRQSKRSRRRGSALIFAVILIAAITIFFVAAQDLMMASVRQQARFEDRTQANYAMESAATRARLEYLVAPYPVPDTRNYSVGSFQVSSTITDNSSILAGTLKVQTQAQRNGRTYQRSFTVSVSHLGAWGYTVYTTGSRTHPHPLTVGPSTQPTRVYFGTDATNGNGSTVDGDLDCSGSIDSSFTVSGLARSGVYLQTLPSFTVAQVLASAPTYKIISGALGNYGFKDQGGEHELLFRDGDLTINGEYTKRGTILVNGNVLIQRLHYKDPTATVAVIATGTISIQSDITSSNGLLLTPGLVLKDGTTSPSETLHFGSILSGELSTAYRLKVQYDPVLQLDFNEGRLLHLPGFIN